MEKSVEVSNNMNGIMNENSNETQNNNNNKGVIIENVVGKTEQQGSIGEKNVECEMNENIIQCQKKIYPCHPAPPVEIKLFVGRVPRTMTEDDITPLFTKYGDVIESIIIRDRSTSAHKGSAFVRMCSISEADIAIKELNGNKILDSNLGAIVVSYATGEAEKIGLTSAAAEAGTNTAKLFIGSIPRAYTEDDIKQMFDPYGTIEDVFIMRDTFGMGKGCAFVKYAYKEQALYASQCLNGKRTLKGCNRPLEVRFAESKLKTEQNMNNMGLGMIRNQHHQHAMMMDSLAANYYACSYNNNNNNNNNSMGGRIPNNNFPRSYGPWKEYFSNEGKAYYHNETANLTTWERPVDFPDKDNNNSSSGGPPGSNLFVFHVPNVWTDEHLICAFSPFGEIKSASIVKDKLTGKNKGYAFVSYVSSKSAAEAICRMNGAIVCGKRLKVSIKQEDQSQLNGGNAFSDNMFNHSHIDNINNGYANINMMNQYAAMQACGAQYNTGYAGNRYAPY